MEARELINEEFKASDGRMYPLHSPAGFGNAGLGYLALRRQQGFHRAQTLMTWQSPWLLTQAPLKQPRTGGLCGRAGSHQKFRCSPGGAGLIHNRPLGICYDEGLPLTFWAISQLPLAVVSQGGDDVEAWLRSTHRTLRAQQYAHFLAICWALWYRRNKWVFKGLDIQAHTMVEMACRQFAHLELTHPVDPGRDTKGRSSCC
ncbi:hypothetical protein Salat_1448400 [Sesamum alatum]|uniref:Uncharacterized protein n=1 Tax=Sesamum alatum TaxID=300844 RepID=A0AAE2CLQ5_9LAMI|nr:hypothetical protein Salat_1448400 [Sesamum alatum]